MTRSRCSWFMPAVQRLGAVAAAVERLGELVDLVAGAAEHDRGGRRLDVEDAPERGRLVRARHHVGASGAPAAPRPAAACLALDRDAHRVVEVRAWRCASMRARHGGREQHRLRVSAGGRRGWRRCPRRSPCRASRRPRRARPSRRASRSSVPRLEVVEGAARRGDDDVDAALAARGAGGRSAGRRRSAAPGRRAPGRSGARPRTTCMASSRVGTSTSAGGACRRPPGVEALQDRQRERRGLAGAGGGLPEQVAPREQRRDRPRAGSAWAPRSRGPASASAAPSAARGRRSPACRRSRPWPPPFIRGERGSVAHGRAAPRLKFRADLPKGRDAPRRSPSAHPSPCGATPVTSSASARS